MLRSWTRRVAQMLRFFSVVASSALEFCRVRLLPACVHAYAARVIGVNNEIEIVEGSAARGVVGFCLAAPDGCH